MQPPSAAPNHTQPCSEPDAMPPRNAPMLQPNPMRAPQPISNPPTAAASSEPIGGHAVIAVGYDLVEHAPKYWNPDGDKRIVVIDTVAAALLVPKLSTTAYWKLTVPE